MGIAKRTLATVPAVPVLGAGLLLAAVVRAAHRSDLPSFPNQDASGVFGDPALPPLRIVCVGDSSLTGPGVEKIDNLFIRHIARTYADRHHVELISLAIGGSKAVDVVEGQLEEAVQLRPDIAVVSVGSNDAIRGVTPRTYRQRMEQILERLGTTAGAIMVLGMGDLGSIPRLPSLLRPYLSRRSRVFDQVASEVACGHPLSAKVWTRGRMTTGFNGNLQLFAGDQFHASDEGHLLFAKEAEPAFRAAYLLAQRRRSAGTSSLNRPGE